MPSSALRYQTLREIGRGGMGSIELVWDVQRQEQVARKRILTLGGSSLVRFKREFRSIARLSHDNLVRLHELDEDAHGPYFTMEYVPGEALLEHCGPSHHAAAVARASTFVSGVRARPAEAHVAPEGWRCSWERLERVVPQIARALDHLHGSGIVHCDLKPSNAIVRDDGVVKLLDFGVVAELAGRRGPGNELVAGTPNRPAFQHHCTV